MLLQGDANVFRALKLAPELRSDGAMLRIAGVSAILLATGCLVESQGPDLTGPDMLGRICTQDIVTTGSFVQSKAAPPNEDGTPYTGCWPIGTWTFTASYGAGGNCETKPALLPQYQFKVEEMLDADGIP